MTLTLRLARHSALESQQLERASLGAILRPLGSSGDQARVP